MVCNILANLVVVLRPEMLVLRGVRVYLWMLRGGGLVYTSNVMTKVVMDCMVDVMEDILFSWNKPSH